MSEYLGQHWIVAVLIAIVLGALGSALWEWALRPLGSKFGNALFSIITLGAKRASDRIYAGASLGHRELPSLNILMIALVMLTALLLSSQLTYYVNIRPSMDDQVFLDACAKKGESEKKGCIREQYKKSIEPQVKIWSALSVFLSVFIFFKFHTVSRMNFIVTGFNHLLRIIRPYIDESKLHLIEQKFALMNNQEDYEELIDNMLTIAVENGVSVPDLGVIQTHST